MEPVVIEGYLGSTFVRARLVNGQAEMHDRVRKLAEELVMIYKDFPAYQGGPRIRSGFFERPAGFVAMMTFLLSRVTKLEGYSPRDQLTPRQRAMGVIS